MTKYAIYQIFGSELVTEHREWMESDDDYIRLSEIIEIDFPMLPKEEVVPKQVKLIDDKIEKARARFQQAISELEDKKSRLLAITYEE